MKSFISSMQVLTVFVALTISCCVCREDTEDMKMRRGGSGTAGLFAFPRVGRRDPSMLEYNPWDNVLPLTYEEYDIDGPMTRINEGKRANLMPFPRVGRPDNDFQKLVKLAAFQQQEQDMEKRTGANPNNGLWFGPRLGKRSSHSANNN